MSTSLLPPETETASTDQSRDTGLTPRQPERHHGGMAPNPSPGPAKKRLRPATYSIAVYLVVLVILLQVGALVSVFWLRQMVVKDIDTNAPPVPMQLIDVPHPADLRPVVPALSRPSTAVTPEGDAARNQPTIGGARMSVPTPETPMTPQARQQRILSLNEEGRNLRKAKDYDNSQRVLEGAEQLDPRDPITLTNLGLLAEAQSNTDRARGYWVRIIELGPGAGEAFHLAQEQLILMGQKPEDFSRPAVPQQAPVAVDTPQIWPRRLFVDTVERVPTPNESPENHFQMRIVIAKDATEPAVDPGKVAVKLFFYDQKGSGEVVPTAATLKVEFEKSRQTWTEENREGLLAKFSLRDDLEGRKYHGYILRIYYKGELQDERVEPDDLLKGK